MISGEENAVIKAGEILKEQGAKKVIFLNTNGPFHTIKLEKAKEEFEKELEKITPREGTVPVIKNIDGVLYGKNENIKEILGRHMVSPVRFDYTIEYMRAQNVDNFIEIGPGKTLTGFIRKSISDVNYINVNNIEGLEEII